MNILFRILNNNWVVSATFASLSLAAAGVPEPVVLFASKLVDYLPSILQALLFVGAALTPVVAYSKIRSWITISLGGEPWWAKWSPILRIVGWWKGRNFSVNHLAHAIGNLQHRGAPIFDLVESPPWIRRSASSSARLTVVLRLPARSYMAIPDFINLHLLRRLSLEGARATVLVSDVTHLLSESRSETEGLQTAAYCRRILGNNANIFRLSNTLADNPKELTRFILDDFVPHMANRPSDLADFAISRNNDSSTTRRATSFLVLGLHIFALSRLIPSSGSVYLMQWRERLSKWDRFEKFPLSSMPVFRVDGFVVNDSLFDYADNAVPTGSHTESSTLFAMTDDTGVVARRLLGSAVVDDKVSWRIPHEYVNELAQLVLNLELDNRPNDRLTWFQKRRILAFVKRFAPHQIVNRIDDGDVWQEIVLRWRFYLKFRGVRRALVRS